MAEQVTQEPEVTPEQTAAPAPEATPQEPSWLGKVKELGFENVSNPEEAIERLASAYRQTKDEFGAQLQQLLEQHKSQPTPQPQVQDAQDGWKPPQIDRRLIAQFKTADGWKEGTPDSVKQQYAAWENYRAQFAESFLDDPSQALDPILQKKFDQYFESKYGQLTQQQQQQQAEQRIYSENPWLFEKDPVTQQPRLDRLSAEGQLIQPHFAELYEKTGDFTLAWKYAKATYDAQKSSSQLKATTQAQTASEINAQRKAEAVNRASGATVNRTGSLPTPADNRASQRNPQLRPGQRALQIAQRNGLAT